jgi:putative hydrolase of the HAD superfamily
LRRLGYAADEAILSGYIRRYDGVEHVQHSADKATYEAWVRFRLGLLADEIGVASSHRERAIDELRAFDRAPMSAYPEARPVLDRLGSQGVLLAVCSNWGWDLDRALDESGLSTVLDVAVTSAQAGCRKPHPRIYRQTLEQLALGPEEVVFVGDSWRPDVVGPLEAGIPRAIHIARRGTGIAEERPPLLPGTLSHARSRGGRRDRAGPQRRRHATVAHGRTTEPPAQRTSGSATPRGS